MNFLKKAVNSAKNGIELETLKYERGNLKKQIKHLETKISTYHQQTELKKTLVEGLEKIDQTFEQVSTMCNLNNVNTTTNNQTTQPSAKANSGANDQDEDSDNGVEDIEDPDSFENIQKASHTLLKSHRDEFRIIVDKLNIMISTGVDKYQAEIDKKRKRIEEINKRLSVIRSKN